jgi:hypothetical protein
MKHANHNKNQHNPAPRTTFKPKPLSVEQENSIDLLLTGKSDREVAEAVGVTRWTVQQWRTTHPVFMAELAHRREEVFGAAVNRLRSLLTKALDNIAAAIESGHASSSWELLRATGLHGFSPPPGEMDPEKILDDLVMRQVAREKISSSTDDLLLHLNDNPRYIERKQELDAALRAEYSE